MVDLKSLFAELTFSASRSSGSGGQNVNKVNTRVELRFSVSESQVLTENQKSVILEILNSRLTKDGELVIASEKTRSQLQNKQDCISRFELLITNALKPIKPRIATKPSKKSRITRIESKKKLSLKKDSRKRPPAD